MRKRYSLVALSGNRYSYNGSVVIAELPQGVVLPATGMVSDYYLVTYQGKPAYIHKDTVVWSP